MNIICQINLMSKEKRYEKSPSLATGPGYEKSIDLSLSYPAARFHRRFFSTLGKRNLVDVWPRS